MAQNLLMPGYETTVITRAELSDEGLKSLTERVSSIISSFGGEVVMTEDWGKKKMAYPIQKENRAQYTYIAYTGKPGVVHEIERNLRIHDHVLRFLTVNVGKEMDSESFRKLRQDMKDAAKKRDEERAARREERNARERDGYDDVDGMDD